jgi:hypothetical protein
VTVLVDSSVWMAHLRDSGGPDLELLEQLIGEQRAVTTDVVLFEVLSGTTHDARGTRGAPASPPGQGRTAPPAVTGGRRARGCAVPRVPTSR